MRRLMILMVAVLGMFGSDAFAIYDAGTGRFMQRDPIKYRGGSMSLYEYVGSSPTKSTDPSGLKLTVGGSSSFRKNVAKSLNEMCPKGDFKINSDGTVESQNDDFGNCNGVNDKDSNPELCNCLRNTINSDRNIRIQPWVLKGGKTANNDEWLPDDEDDPWGDGVVHIGRGMENNGVGYPGHYDSVDDAKKIWPRNIHRVPWNMTIAIAHELCAHAMDNLDHRNPDGSPSKDAYTENDPVIKRENEYRDELGPGYGTRTGT